MERKEFIPNDPRRQTSFLNSIISADTLHIVISASYLLSVKFAKVGNEMHCQSKCQLSLAKQSVEWAASGERWNNGCDPPLSKTSDELRITQPTISCLHRECEAKIRRTTVSQPMASAVFRPTFGETRHSQQHECPNGYMRRR